MNCIVLVMNVSRSIMIIKFHVNLFTLERLAFRYINNENCILLRQTQDLIKIMVFDFGFWYIIDSYISSMAPEIMSNSVFVTIFTRNFLESIGETFKKYLTKQIPTINHRQ